MGPSCRSATDSSRSASNNMVSEILKTIIEFLKLAPRYLIALGLMAACLLFSPDSFLKKMGVSQFVQDNRSWLGLLFIGTTALFLVSIAGDILKSLKRWRLNRRAYAQITDRLNHLTEDEKQILRYYIAKQTRANTLRMDDGVVQGLAAAGILYRSTSMGSVVEGFGYNISDTAWEYLNVFPNLLEGSTNTYRTDKRDRRW